MRVALFSSALPGWDAERVVDAARTLGLDAVEWGVGPGQAIASPDDGARIAALCRSAGLAVAGVAVQDPDVTLATARTAARHVALAVALRSPHVRFFAPVYDGGRLAPAQRRARAGVDSLVNAAAAARVGVLVETSPGTLAPSGSLALALVGHHPPARAGVLYDPGNTVIEGYVSPALALARLGRHLRHVHVKNIAWSRRGGAWRWGYATIDGGIVDWPATLRALAASRYRGRVSIDHLRGRPTLGLLRGESERLRELLAQTAG
jgi:sugar phosphate isomerase/epimerase